jgi:hypothetical protein
MQFQKTNGIRSIRNQASIRARLDVGIEDVGIELDLILNMSSIENQV